MTFRALAATLVLALSATPLSAQWKPTGTGTIYVGSYSGHITAVDESTGAVTKIALKTGSPYIVRLAPDRTKFYVQSANQERFEVVDVASRQSVDTFTLSDARRHVRALTYEADPTHRAMLILARTSTKQIDRWEIGEPEFLLYDLAQHRVIQTFPWRLGFEPNYYNVALRFSPDGKLLYVFGEKVTIFDAATMAQVDEWELSLPPDPAFGRFEPGAWDDSADPQGKVTVLFTMRDAIMNRKLLVVGQVDLAAKSVEVFPLGPEPTSGISFRVAPDHRHAHILLAEIGRHELWTIDMEARKVTNRVEVPTRTRMQMSAGTGGLLYLCEAGRTIEVYSADAKTRLRTIELDSDMMYGTFVVVPGSGARR
ncbi:MAG: hypothetical protein R2745_09355 [Vicinamibacterales bacterium]